MYHEWEREAAQLKKETRDRELAAKGKRGESFSFSEDDDDFEEDEEEIDEAVDPE